MARGCVLKSATVQCGASGRKDVTQGSPALCGWGCHGQGGCPGAGGHTQVTAVITHPEPDREASEAGLYRQQQKRDLIPGPATSFAGLGSKTLLRISKQ